MRAKKTRIDKLERSLTPKEAVILWMEEAHKTNGFVEYTASLVGQPNASFPLYRLPEQVEAEVHRQFKGEAEEDVEREVRQRVRDVVFLFHIHQEANKRVMEKHRATLMHSLFLLERLRRLIFCNAYKDRGIALRGEAATWRELADPLLKEIYTLQGTLVRLENTYFDGHGLLFPATREALEFVSGWTKQSVDMYNDQVDRLNYVPGNRKRKGDDQGQAETLRLDTDGMRTAVQQDIAFSTSEIVILAKAEALEFMGEREAGLALVERLVSG